MRDNFELNFNHILTLTDGALLAPIKIVSQVLGIKNQTISNRLSSGTFCFEIVRVNGRPFVRCTDLAHFVTTGIVPKNEIAQQNVIHLENKKAFGRPLIKNS